LKLSKANKLWRKLFGMIGREVVLKKRFQKQHPYMYVWYSPSSLCIKIPVEKFVGVIVSKRIWSQGQAYDVRWIADRRSPSQARSFIWRRHKFDILGEKETG